MDSDSVRVIRPRQELTLEPSDRSFLPLAGKRIEQIRVRTIAVFGGSVNDTTQVAKSRVLRLLNHLNFQTRDTAILRNLLFREGDVLDPLELADSERILRNLPFIGDARIVAAQSRANVDAADVVVIVRESWTLSLSASMKEGDRLRVSLVERNVLGLGHRVSGALTFVPGTSPSLDTKYAVPNIRGTFVTGEFDYADRTGQRAAGISLSRELVSTVLRYAGGLNLLRTWAAAEDSLPTTADHASNLLDLWTGRQFRPGPDHRADRSRILFVSGRVRHLHFTKRPPDSLSAPGAYRNATHVLGSLALIQSHYYRTNLLYDFGRTEDVPYGFLTRLTYGFADQGTGRSTYAAATAAAGHQIVWLGYGFGEVQIGGYPKNRRLEDGVIRLRTLYFSDLLHLGGVRLRQFAGAAYSTGIHRRANDSITFGGDTAIRGVVYDSGVIGTKRLQFNLETVAFSPWRVRGVTLAFFTFADVDLIGSGRENLLAQEYYSGLGLGVRLHREAYGIGPVELRFAWYPRLPVDHNAYSYAALGEKRFRSIELLGTKPEIVDY